MPLPPLPASGNGGASQSILCCLHPRARSVHRPARSHTRGSVPYERTARALTPSRTVHFSPPPPCSRKLTKNSRVARARRGPVQLQNWPSPRPGPGHPQTGPGHPPGPVRFPAWPGPPPWPGPGRPGLDPVRAQARADWPGPPTGPGHSGPGLGRGAEAPDARRTSAQWWALAPRRLARTSQLAHPGPDLYTWAHARPPGVVATLGHVYLRG